MGWRIAALPRSVTRGMALWGVATVAVLGLVGVGAFAYTHRDKAASATAKTALATVRRGQVTVSEAAAGTVQATGTRGLSFAVSGTVTSIAVKAGDKVTSGQVLARIDDSDAQDAVSKAESDVATAEQSVTDAESTASASTGCVAAAAYQSPSPSYSPSPAASASPSVTRPTAAAPSQAASTSNCGNTGNNSRAGNGTDSLYSAQQQLNNAKLALTQAQADLDGTVITAPIDGRVLSVNGTVGTTESPGSTAFVTVGATADTVVQAQFSEADVAGLAVGQRATISLASRTDAFNGKVSQIDPAGTASSQLVRYTVLIAFEDPPDNLLYGQSANVVVTTGSAANVLYVSSSAVTTGTGDTATVTVRAGGRDQSRTVQIGLHSDQYTEIRSGLTEGEVVVVTGG
jgi:HlyD family secretion protein